MYLILFGKAQSFIFYAFDESGLVTNFNKIIPDFDLLESQLLNVDKEENKDVFAKYIFVKGSPDPYSLIKIYSPAQPSQGFRIDGCIYGVAFLSKENIKISSNNIQILNGIKNAFASVSLSGIKFLKTDFKEEAVRVYYNFVQQIGFSKIEKNNLFENNQSNNTTGIVVKNLLNFNVDVSHLSNKIYITEDIDRLLRAQKKWGEKSIIILESVNNSFQEYKVVQEAITKSNNINGDTSQNQNNTKSNDLNDEKALLKLRISDIEKQYNLIEKKLKNAIISNQRQKLFLRIFIFLFIISTLVIGFLVYKQWTKAHEVAAVQLDTPQTLESEQVPQSIQNITINNSLDIMQKWENKKDFVDFVNLIIKLEAAKTTVMKDSLKRKILKKGFENDMDTATINIFLKNI
jgi:hypothetical protein